MRIQIINKLWLTVLICLPIQAAGQKILDPVRNPSLYNTEFIHPDEGLSSPLLRCIYEDQYGFIWIGSQYGLDRYDGYSLTRMSYVGSDSAITSMEWIWSIEEDRSGTLWVCSSRGLFRYDRIHNIFEMLLPDKTDPSSGDNTVYAINQDSKGICWLFTRGGLFSYDRIRNQFKDYKKDSILTDENILNWDPTVWWNKMRFYEDHSGTIWIGTYNGLKKFDVENDRFLTFHHDPENHQSLAGNLIGAIAEDNQGNLWISTIIQDGSTSALHRMIDRDKGVFRRYSHDPSDPSSLVSDTIWPLYIDRHSNLWIGGKNGLSKYNPDSDDFENYCLPKYSIPEVDFPFNHKLV